jgi:uncharacterized protein (TIGR02246 family)
MPSISEDRDEIRDLFARYCVHIDSGEGAEWAGLFTEDGVFEVGADPLVGREALAAFASSLGGAAMHHMVLNEVIDVEGDVASCRASIVVVAGGQLVTTGRYRDTLRREDGRWRIARRSFTPDVTSS